MMVVNMLDVEFYTLYNGLQARDLMPIFCCDFCDFLHFDAKICFFASIWLDSFAWLSDANTWKRKQI